ncbi:MAG: saccharopine dehydrogenase C-terminal domain-containing protein [Thermodesulfobacteriota bacterium]
MKVLLLGAGAVGEAYAVLTARADPGRLWLEKLVIADQNLERAEEVAGRLGPSERYPVDRVEAGRRDEVAAVVARHGVDLVLNACPQHFNQSVFDACLAAGRHYMDMAMTLSRPHSTEPHRKVGVLLGDYQFARHRDWEARDRLALLGMGADPGLSEVFAKYAEIEFFDEIDEIHVRDGSDLTVEGYKYATAFSAWSVMEECLNPPVFWEAGPGYYTSEPMSAAEIFDFPELGPLETVAIEHEEVINLPRWINKGLRRVSFKISLGRNMMRALRLLYELGLTSSEPVEVKGWRVAPRDVVEACLPSPARIGPRMEGRVCVCTLVRGRKDGRPREVHLYQLADNQECMRRLGCQAVAAQTAVGPAVATELLATGLWTGRGVLPPEAFDPRPCLDRLDAHGFPYRIKDSWSEET